MTKLSETLTYMRIALGVVALLASACGAEVKSTGRSGGGGQRDLTPVDVSADGTGKTKPKDDIVKGGDGSGDDADGGDGTDGDDGTDGKDQPLSEVIVALGLRNFEQINATMSTLTGVPTTNATVRATFTAELTTSLPTNNDVKAFLGSQQVAIFKLAVEYCDVLVKDAALRAATFPGFNFAAAPQTALDATGKQLLAGRMVDKFWGSGLSTLPPRAETTASVTALIDALLVGKNATAANVTVPVVTGACAAVLSAAPVSLY